MKDVLRFLPLRACCNCPALNPLRRKIRAPCTASVAAQYLRLNYAGNRSIHRSAERSILLIAVHASRKNQTCRDAGILFHILRRISRTVTVIIFGAGKTSTLPATRRRYEYQTTAAIFRYMSALLSFRREPAYHCAPLPVCGVIESPRLQHHPA